MNMAPLLPCCSDAKLNFPAAGKNSPGPPSAQLLAKLSDQHRPQTRAPSLYHGTSLQRSSGRWVAHFRQSYLGLYATLEEAARAYDAVAHHVLGA